MCFQNGMHIGIIRRQNRNNLLSMKNRTQVMQNNRFSQLCARACRCLRREERMLREIID